MHASADSFIIEIRTAAFVPGVIASIEVCVYFSFARIYPPLSRKASLAELYIYIYIVFFVVFACCLIHWSNVQSFCHAAGFGLKATRLVDLDLHPMAGLWDMCLGETETSPCDPGVTVCASSVHHLCLSAHRLIEFEISGHVELATLSPFRSLVWCGGGKK